MDDPKVDDPLSPLHTPRHPRPLQALAEHRLARRLRHPAADLQFVHPAAYEAQLLFVAPQVAVRLPVGCSRTHARDYAAFPGPLIADPSLFLFTGTTFTYIYTLSLHDALPI